MAILQLRAVRAWSLEQTVKVFLVTADTIGSWTKRINHVWHVDLTLVPTRWGFWASWLPYSLLQCWPFGYWVAVVIDHFSRRAMGFAVFQNTPASRDARSFLGRLIHQAQATPKCLICDKGKQFWCQGFNAWCKRKDIRPRFGATGQHGSIAVVERFIQTVKVECTRKLLVSLRPQTFGQSWLGSVSGITSVGRTRPWEEGRQTKSTFASGLPIAVLASSLVLFGLGLPLVPCLRCWSRASRECESNWRYASSMDASICRSWPSDGPREDPLDQLSPSRADDLADPCRGLRPVVFLSETSFLAAPSDPETGPCTLTSRGANRLQCTPEFRRTSGPGPERSCRKMAVALRKNGVGGSRVLRDPG